MKDAKVMIKKILLDIEGTTTSISFVHDVLFPYAKLHLFDFVRNNITNIQIKEIINDTIKTIYEEDGKSITEDEAIKVLLHWIDIDRKHNALKILQGIIWKSGYENGDYKAHVYNDVLPCIKEWISSGMSIYIYSSGSVKAQKLLFKHTECGDLTPFISGYFDLLVGNKQDCNSYVKIIDQIKEEPKNILFLSDSVNELDAAMLANMSTTQLVRPGTSLCQNHPTVNNFKELDFTTFAD